MRSNDLARLLGRLNNAAYVVPFSRHFTGRLYKVSRRSERKGSNILSGTQLDNLVLEKVPLARFEGDFNQQTGVSISDVESPSGRLPAGDRGYCLQSGVDWRYKPQDPCWDGPC